MRRYETIFILRPNAGEEEIERIIGYTADIITQEQGTVIELDKWGIKKLAYLIKKESLGYYVYCDYAGTPASVSEIERKFRIDDSVLKYLTIKTASAITTEEIEQSVADVQAKMQSAEEAAAEADQSEKPKEETAAETSPAS
jgi:small subunit ribosomal protein S6